MLLTTALIGAALLQPTAATAQAPPCRGQAVTVDGTGATQVVGTEGNDVISPTPPPPSMRWAGTTSSASPPATATRR